MTTQEPVRKPQWVSDIEEIKGIVKHIQEELAKYPVLHAEVVKTNQENNSPKGGENSSWVPSILRKKIK